MLACTRPFGGREPHQNGTPHYHVVFSFSRKEALAGCDQEILYRTFREVGTKEMCGRLSQEGHGPSQDGETLRERLPIEKAVAEVKTRKWQDIVDETDQEKE